MTLLLAALLALAGTTNLTWISTGLVDTGQLRVVEATSYTLADAETRPWNDGLTASGKRPVAGETLACGPDLPLGAHLKVLLPDGWRQMRCDDRGGSIVGQRIDIFMSDRREALRWGRRNVLVARPTTNGGESE